MNNPFCLIDKKRIEIPLISYLFYTMLGGGFAIKLMDSLKHKILSHEIHYQTEINRTNLEKIIELIEKNIVLIDVSDIKSLNDILSNSEGVMATICSGDKIILDRVVKVPLSQFFGSLLVESILHESIQDSSNYALQHKGIESLLYRLDMPYDSLSYKTELFDTYVRVMFVDRKEKVQFYYPFPKGKFYVSSPFGYRKIDSKIRKAYSLGGVKMRSSWGFHRGIDLATKLYMPVKSPIFGFIESIGYNHSYGYYIILRSKKDKKGYYLKIKLAHLTFGNGKRYLNLRKGMPVDTSTVIGYVGLTGATTGPHVHYETYLCKGKREMLFDPIKGKKGYRIRQRVRERNVIDYSTLKRLLFSLYQ